MTKELLINHKRFKKGKSTIKAKKYFAFFNDYAKKNYFDAPTVLLPKASKL
mgnify:CR=1 FL=1